MQIQKKRQLIAVKEYENGESVRTDTFTHYGIFMYCIYKNTHILHYNYNG